MGFANNPHVANTGSVGMAPILNVYPEAATQTFTAGEMVYLDTTNHRVTVCASDAVLILGQAQEAASGTAADDVVVQVFRADDLIRMKVTNGGTQVTTENFVKLRNYGIYAASNVQYADYADTTNDAVVFIDHIKDGSGAYTNFGLFKLLPAIAQYSYGISSDT
jgi:hypothetical protein